MKKLEVGSLVLEPERVEIEKIPEFITELSELTELNLQKNKIRHLPEFITHLPRLKVIDLSHNPIKTIPPRLRYSKINIKL